MQIYKELESALHGLIGKVKFSADINLKLERIARLLALAGDPHVAYPVIHVGGTSGKGSTSTFIAHILQADGLRVGLHRSPHLQVLNERHWVNGRYAPTSTLLRLFRQLEPAIAQVAQEMPQFGTPSYFEVQLSLSLLYFAEQAVDVAVVEVGLGGKLDATNVIPATIAVLTNVGLDHTQILGDTVELIAQDKVGIIKQGQTVVSAVRQPSVQEIVQTKCEAVGATLWLYERDFALHMPDEDFFAVRLPHRQIGDLWLTMHGQFQRLNAAVALAAAEAFQQKVYQTALPDEVIRRGLEEATFAGRMEVVQRSPTVLLDGAHNPDKLGAILPLIQQAEKRTITVLALKKGKDATQIVPAVAQMSDLLILTEFAPKGLWQSVPAEELAQLVAEGMVVKGAETAVRYALSIAQPNDLIWVTGSLYLVGDVREMWFPQAEILQELEEA